MHSGPTMSYDWNDIVFIWKNQLEWVESLDRRLFILSKFCIKPFKRLGVIMLSLNMTFHKVHVIADK
jgi:hypothetical protein